MKTDYLEQLKVDIAARFERDLRKPKSKFKSEVKVFEEDKALEQKKWDHFTKLLMAEAVRQLK